LEKNSFDIPPQNPSINCLWQLSAPVLVVVVFGERFFGHSFERLFSYSCWQFEGGVLGGRVSL
ncbi:hypothetical protein, partial [Escherichia coli]|uniref:hypothetical protein n=1 Tax=Escherichia coli TaxID=562 RepID=UPI003D3549E6